MTRILFISLFLILGSSSQAQFLATPPALDGTISPGEYGSTSPGTNQVTSAAITWYCNWDANNIYFAIQGANVFEGAVLYFDTDPTIPVNGGGNVFGSTTWPGGDYDATRFHYPIRSDVVLYVRSNYNEFRYADDAGSWTNVVGIMSVSSNAANQVIEFTIPWNNLTNGAGRPTAFNWFGYKLYNNGTGDNGMYSSVPQFNPITPNNATTGNVNEVYPVYYYTVVNTDDGTSTKPFSARSFTYHEDVSTPTTGGYVLNTESLFDVTVNDNSADNSDNDFTNDAYDNQEIANRLLISGNVTIGRNLVIGRGSALLPADNTNSSITMTGSSASIYNEGRLDCTPEVAVVGDWNNRSLDFYFDGQVTYQASTLFKDRARFSDIFISNGNSLRGPSSGSAQIEFQYGTLTNYGVLDFTNGGTGSLTFDTRGDSPTTNNYYLSSPDSSGVFILDGLLIGRDESILQPDVNGGLIQLEVHGNFENYHQFIPRVTGGQIDVIMAGDARQEIRGNVLETLNSRTEFHNLVIDNDNGAGDNNANADVHFLSFGGAEIDYLITGSIELRSGDLVTRDRLSSVAHKLVIDSMATVIDALAVSDVGGDPSSFVDGPLYRVTNSMSDTLEFAIGKDGSHRDTEVGLYALSFQRDTIVAELFHESSYTLGNSLPLLPEPILNTSEVHWWQIESSASFPYDSAMVKLSYGPGASGDWVPDPAGLRIVRAPNGGGSTWTNITPFRGAVSTGVEEGYFYSDMITSLGDFTFGNVTTNPLPVELISFDARLEKDEVFLEWITASEVNSSHFDLLHSRDGQYYEKFSEERAMGNSSSTQAYMHIHSDPSEGYNYYKLIQYDLDGSSEELGLEVIWYHGADLSIGPNPFLEELTLAYPDSWSGSLVKILDNSGRLVHQSVLSAKGRVELGRELPPGHYTLQLNSADSSEEFRIFKY